MSNLRSMLDEVSSLLPEGAPVLYLRRLTGDRPLVWLSSGAESLTGVSAATLVGSAAAWASLIHADDRDRILAALGAPTPSLPGVLEYRIITGSGEVRWIQDRIRPVPVREATPLLAVGILSDVTERRTLEHRMGVLEERLWQAQRVESVGALAGGVAHDFNNLLTAIISSVQLIAEQPRLDPETRQDLMVIRTAAERGAALVRQILGFSSRAGRQPAGTAGSGNVGSAVLELEGILRRTLGDGVRLEVRVEEGVWPVPVEPVRLEQVILNLAVNAREAMPQGGLLEISVENIPGDPGSAGEDEGPEAGDQVCLRVRDTGSGIPPEIQDRIFEPYFSTKGTPEGGLGLATVRKILQGCGGSIRVESEPGAGTTFTLLFPVRRGTSMPLAASVAASAGVPARGGFRVLVVEDDPGVRALVERTLARLGHQAVGAASAADAIRIFDRVRPSFDLLLADVILPDRPGPELHRALARRVPGLPVVYMSGFAPEELGQRGGGGIEGPLLSKPFSPEQLRAVIHQAMAEARRRSSARRPPLLEMDGGG